MRAAFYEKEQQSDAYYVYEYRFVFKNTSVGGMIENGKILPLKKCRKIAKDSIKEFMLHEKISKKEGLKKVANFNNYIFMRDLRQNGFNRVSSIFFSVKKWS